MMKKFPPIEKILEAYTAIADGHVKLENDQALVTSSNDNASYWQGYLSYPGIAVLMLQGKLPYDKELAQQFAGVDWNKINQEYKRNYAQAADAVMTAKGIDKKKAETELHHVYDALKQLPIIVKRGSLRPPKAN
ncbi:hypothetical protein [Limosilactobacillus reuteri]|uniref:Uncharacterized protein n=1 Tax=Limosilactobacillus reuteri TaxID=1598 RepID=A0A0U5EZU1_LIMRT|nr:Putative uncharacterized protein ST0479 [Limosilactobacillus reuteri]